MSGSPQDFRYKPISTAVGKLYTMDGIRERFAIGKRVLRELTNTGFMPHFRMKGFDDPLFDLTLTKEWIAKNLVDWRAGITIPKTQVVVIADEDKQVFNVPKGLATITDLRELRPELFCGIYFLCLDDAIVYVGQSKNIPYRVVNHSKDKKFNRVFFLRLPPSQLEEAEIKFIQALKPSLNTTHKPKEAEATPTKMQRNRAAA